MWLHGGWPARQAVGLQQLLRASVRTASAYSSASNRRQSAAATAAAQGGDAVTSPQKGQQLELECSDLAFGGEGICKLPGGGLVVFVERALPGERLVARITETKKRFAKAVKLSTLQEHAAAVEPPCQHFGPCGGCTLQNLQYEAQLAAKQRQVAELLRRTAGVADVEAVMRPIVGCPPGQQYGYRNKMEFSFCGPEAALEGGGADGREARGRKHTRNRSSGRSSAGARKAAAPGAAAAANWSPGGGVGTTSSSSSSSSGGSGGDGSLVLGLKRPGSNASVLPITRCHLQSDAANELLQLVLRLCRQHGLQPYDSATRSGLLQHVVIRRGSTARERGAAATNGSTSTSISSSSGSRGGTDDGRPNSTGSPGSTASSSSGTEEYLVNIVTAADGRKALAPLASALTQQAAQLSSTQSLQQPGAPSPSLPAGVVVAGIVNSVLEPGRPTGERRLAAEHVLAGRGFLYEQLLGLEFEVSANSFFQTNSRQAEALYSLVAAAAELRGTDVLLDLYCGTGSIGLCLAGACKQVRGVEISASAVADAERNAARNGITNAAFLQGDLHKLQLEGRLAAPDVVVVDPARPGLSPAVITYLQTCGARRIVYVSCNASTQARDIALLCGAGNGGGSGGFRLVSIQAVDLYPQTWHVETVAVLDAVVGA